MHVPYKYGTIKKRNKRFISKKHSYNKEISHQTQTSFCAKLRTKKERKGSGNGYELQTAVCTRGGKLQIPFLRAPTNLALTVILDWDRADTTSISLLLAYLWLYQTKKRKEEQTVLTKCSTPLRQNTIQCIMSKADQPLPFLFSLPPSFLPTGFGGLDPSLSSSSKDFSRWAQDSSDVAAQIQAHFGLLSRFRLKISQ